MLASAGSDATIRVWDPTTGAQRAVLNGHRGDVWAVCALKWTGREMLASAGADATVRIWDPDTGQQRAVLEGHQETPAEGGGVFGVCAVQVGGREMLASAGTDRTVRIWDPVTGVCALTIPVLHQALAVVGFGRRLAIGLGAGILVIDLHIGS